MSTLRVCMKKAGKALSQGDQDAILALRDEFVKDGVEPVPAGRMAVIEHLSDLQKEAAGMEGAADAFADQGLDDFLLKDFDAMLAEVVAPAEPESEPVEPEKNSGNQEVGAQAKIEDFGEKIGGARKDVYQRSMGEDMPDESKDIKLAKHFPVPKYHELIADGVDVKAAALVAAMRDSIPNKPRSRYKLNTWGRTVREVRELADRLVGPDSEAAMAQIESAAKKWADTAQFYIDVGFPEVQDLGGWTVEKNHYVRFGDERNVDKWDLQPKRKGSSAGMMMKTSLSFDTREEAVQKMKEIIAARESEPKKGKAKTKLDLYSNRRTGDVWIGKKVGSRKYIDLKRFDDVREARAYLADHYDELLETLAIRKKNPAMRKERNDARVGKDHREGRPVTPEQFGAAFGFRGVEFGNWVENDKRQESLNDAYDALMDLSGMLNISPQAISLGGRLGLAFGARGTGGKKAAAAHYEPSAVAINLTKKQGAGSLAHEWMHALDDYFGRQLSGNSGNYISGESTRSIDRRISMGGDVRPEVSEAWMSIMTAIRSTDLRPRSVRADNTRAKDYYKTPLEMIARSFERYVIDKASSYGEANDYLANIVSEKAWELGQLLQEGVKALGPDQSSYPYPTDDEALVINPMFDALFDVLEERDGDKPGSKALYSLAYHGSPHQFDKFRSAAIGTGEGNQNPAYGLYFSSSREVADWYRDTLSREQKAGEGALYEAEIPESDVMINADKPLNQQPEIVVSALEQLGFSEREVNVGLIAYELEVVGENDAAIAENMGQLESLLERYKADPFGDTTARRRLNRMFAEYQVENDAGDLVNYLDELEERFAEDTGKHLYDQLAQELGSDRAASKALERLGVSGMTYRGVGSGEQNYVVFDDEAISIISRTPSFARPGKVRSYVPKGRMSNSEVWGAIRDQARAVSDSVGMRVEVVHSSELPVEITSGLTPGVIPQGAFLNNTVYLVSNALQDANDARVTFQHEVVGHLGVNKVVGDKWPELRSLYQQMKKINSKAFADVYADMASRYMSGSQKLDELTEVSEFIAVAAEWKMKSGPVASFMSKVRQFINRWARAVGFNRPFSVDDVNELLGASARYISTGKGYGSAQTGSAPAYHLDHFYSAVERAVEGLGIAKWKNGGAAHWEAVWAKIRNAQVKKDELTWLGLEEFLQGKGQVTRDEVLGFVRGNGVNVEAIVADDNGEPDARPGFSEPEAFDYEKELEISVAQMADNLTAGPRGSSFHVRGEYRGWAAKNAGKIREKFSDHSIIRRGPDIQEISDSMLHDDLTSLLGGEYETWLMNNAIPDLTQQYRDRFAYENGRRNALSDEVRAKFEREYHADETEVTMPPRTIQRLSRSAGGDIYIVRGALGMWRVHTGSLFEEDVVERDIESEAEAQVLASSYADDYFDQSEQPTDTRWESYSMSGMYQNYREVKLTLPDINQNGEFVEYAHFDDPNIVAFLRTTEREFSAGERSFFIEELQSDWHQKGARTGYRDGLPQDYLDKRVPNAPFKKDAWMNLGVKQALVMAASEGMDSLSWASADTLADRWGEKFRGAYEMQYNKKMVSAVRKLTGNEPVNHGAYWSVPLGDAVRDEMLIAGVPLFSLPPSEDEYNDQELDAIAHGGFGLTPPSRSVRSRFNEIKYRAKTKFRQGALDQYDSIKSILDEPRTWMKAQMAEATWGTIEASMEHGHVYMHDDGVLQIKEGTKGLKEILAPLGADIDRFTYWIAGHRAEKLYAEDRENLFNLAQIQVLKNMGKNKKPGERGYRPDRERIFEEVRAEFEAYGDSIVRVAVETGLVDEAEADTWKEEGFYLPFYRVLGEDEKSPGPRIGTGGLVRQQAYKKLKGGEQQLDDLLGNALLNWNHLLTASLKNQVARESLEKAESMGLASEVNKHKAGKNAVYVRVDGKEKWYDIEEGQDSTLVLEALSALHYNGMQGIGYDALRKAKRALTIGVTASPEFKVANLIRDTMQAIAVTDLDVNMYKNVTEGYKATAEDSEVLPEMLASGAIFAGSGYIHGADPDALRHHARKGIERDTVLDVRMGAKKGWDWWQDWGGRLENVNRAALYMQTLNKTNDRLEAAFASRDLLDFTRRGSNTAVRFMVSAVPFLNARMQGLDRVARSFNKEQGARLAAVTGAYSLMSIGLYMLARGHDDFDEIEDWERDTYHLIKVGDTWLRIPRPFEVGFMANMVERAAEQMIDDKVGGEVFFERAAHGIFQTLSFNPIPQLFMPALEVFANYNSFTGRSIEGLSHQMSGVSKSERSNPGTTDTAIALSKGMEAVVGQTALSPVQVDHLVNGYFGWAGATVLAGTDILTHNLVDSPVKPAKKFSEYPLIKRFVRKNPSRNTKYDEQFYDQMEEINRHWADIKLYQKQGQSHIAKEVQAENPNLNAQRSVVKSSQKQLSAINARKKAIYASRDMSAEEKREALDELDIRSNIITKRAVQRLDSINE